MDNCRTLDITLMDDMTLLYTAIYADDEMARLLNENMHRIENKDIADAMYYAAMGRKKDLLKLVQQNKQS